MLSKIVAEDIIVSVRSDDERSSARDELAFDYLFTLIEKDRLEIQLNFRDPSFVGNDDYVIIQFHREIFNPEMFYRDNAELLIDIDEKNITRSMTNYDSVKKVMPAQMREDSLELITSINFYMSYIVKG